MRRYAFILPCVFIALSTLLFVTSYFAVRSHGFIEQQRLAANDDAEPPLFPYLLPTVSLAVVRGPAVIFSTFDISEFTQLYLLPTGVLWWWWMGAELDSRGKARRSSRLKGTLYALLSLIAVTALISITPDVARRYWRHSYFGLDSWRGAMFTADVLWMVALVTIATVKAMQSFPAKRLS